METHSITFASFDDVLPSSEVNKFDSYKDQVKFVRLNDEMANGKEIVSITFKLENIKTLMNHFYTHDRFIKLKENYYVTAINNLMKKNEFLQLNLQLEQQVIDFKEYVSEIEGNHNKYVIELDNSIESNHINIISDIISRINKRVTIDEVSELFSVEPNSLKRNLISIQNDKE